MKELKNYIRKIKNNLINEALEDRVEEILEKLQADEFDYVEEGNLCECGGKLYEGECTECGMKYENQEILELDDEEIGEGNKFTGALAKARREGEKTFSVDGDEYKTQNESVLYQLSDEKGSELFTEEEVVDLIESIINEDKKKSNIKKGVRPNGLTAYEKSHKESKKENDDYLKSVMKKMKDYLKDGSKGTYEPDPRQFPKGNGQLAKMKTQKYTMSDAGDEFLDDYMHPGMEDLVPDEIEYEDGWIDDLIKGSSRTGNNPEWANAEETDLGEKLKKKRKTSKLNKAKMTAYRKSKQPITDKPGENSGKGIDIKLENTESKKEKLMNEEFSRMTELINYKKSTQ